MRVGSMRQPAPAGDQGDPVIASEVPWLADLLACVAFGAVCFALGVGWAAYRAVGWVDRMKAWAHSAPVVSEESS